MSRVTSSACRKAAPTRSTLHLVSLEDRSVPATVAIGQAAVAGADDVARNGDILYVSGTNGISVFNVAGANLNNPQLVRTVGQRPDRLEVRGNLLVAVRGGNSPNSTRLDTYSLTDPANPQLLGTTGEIPYSDGAADLLVTDTHAFLVLVNLHFIGTDIFDQTGGVLAINITNPAAPFLDGDAVTAKGTPVGRDGVNDGVLFNDNGTTNDGVKLVSGIDQSGGNQNTWQIAQASPTIVYVTGSSSTGGNTQSGSGLLRVVDISDPRNMRLIRDVQIPGTVQVLGLSVAGNRAFVTGSQGGWNDNTSDFSFTGKAVLGTLNIADPANPQLIRSQVVTETSRGIGAAAALGNGLFAYNNQGANATDPGLFVVSTNATPFAPVGIDIPNAIVNMVSSGNLLFTTDGSKLIIYQETPTNTAPTISDIANQSSTGSSVGPISFTVGDADTPIANLTVTATSSNPALIPNANVTFGGSGASRTVTVAPLAGQSGTSTITVTVSDGTLTASDTFAVNVAIPGTSKPVLVGFPQFAVGTDVGGTGSVIFYNPDKSVRATVQPFGNFTGGVRTAAADFNNDGVADIVAGTGPGRATQVVVLDGKSQSQLFSVAPFESSFTGGVYVSAGDVNGDGTPDLAITPDEGGGPRVDIYRGGDFKSLIAFFGIDDTNFRGGARAAIGDLNADGVGDLVVAAGFGGGPRVAGFNGRSLFDPTAPGALPPKLFGDFFAFEDSLRNGIFVTVGDVNGDGRADLIAGGGPGGGPRASVFDAVALQNNQQNRIADFFGGDPNSRGGIRLAVKDLDADNRADLVVGAGRGSGSKVTAYLGKTITSNGTPPSALDFDAFAGFTGGVFVG